MYRNPLNDGDISDYNSLKKQRDYGAIVKKYQSRKLKTEPNELQKYYQYMTYQKPILDELNYVAERMKNENIQKKKDDFNFIEDLKIKREKEMKEKSKLEEDIKKVRESLFDYSSTVKKDDMTPTITTDMELELEPLTPREASAVTSFFEIEEERLSRLPPMLRERTYTEEEKEELIPSATVKTGEGVGVVKKGPGRPPKIEEITGRGGGGGGGGDKKKKK